MMTIKAQIAEAIKELTEKQKELQAVIIHQFGKYDSDA